jgi:eukaryotic-like serine/threonine-protein kinase
MERLGRYQIERELGRGSMSIVYEAFDPHINRHLAVKVLRERYARNVKSRQRFLREARSAGGLSHPNIVTVFDVGQFEGAPFLVMERLQGESLEEFLSDGDVLETREIIDIGIQLSSALHYAHDRGVIHRDIKPSNIYFERESGLIKLVDFGIAAIDRRMREGKIADDESITGTPRYMAPEQLQGGPPDHRTDLYSLGVVLYRLLSGRLPFRDDSLGTLIRQVVNEPPPPLHPQQEKTPVELIELVMRLLAKEADSRYQDGAQVLEELQEIRADMDRGLLKQAHATSSTWRWPLVLSLGLAMILGAGLTWVYHSQISAMTETTYGYGDALASVIARETAEALLLEDATALSNLVSDFSVNPHVTHLHVSDRQGNVQASTDPFLQGESLPETPGTSVDRAHGGIRLIRLDNGNLEFQTPVRFQARRIGQAQLGIDGGQLQSAARTTLSMLLVVFLVTVMVGAIGFAWAARWQQRSIQRIAWGLQRIARGQYDFRLDDSRQDGLGPIYRRFNDMAVRLEERHGHAKMKRSRPLQPVTETVTEDTLDSGVDPTMEMMPENKPSPLRSVSGGKSSGNSEDS